MHFGLHLQLLQLQDMGDVYPVTAEGRIIGGILISIGIAVILGFVSRYGTTLIEARAKSNVKLALAHETKTLIKDKIDGIEVLTKKIFLH